MSSPSSRSSRRANKSPQDPRPESPLSDRSPRHREPTSKKKSASAALAALSPKTPLPLPNSSEAPKHPRRYSTEKVTDFRLEEVHRPTDRVVHVDLEEIEGNTRGGTPSPSFSIPADGTMLNDSHVSSRSKGPKTSTPIKSASKSQRAPESLYKKVLMKSTSRTRTAIPPSVADSTMDSYRTAPESLANSSLGSSMSPIRIDADGYRSANSTQRALFSQQGPAPLSRRQSRSSSRSRRSPAPSAATMCQLVTPLVVHTSQEVNAVSATGQVLVISQTLVRSAHASTDVRRLMNKLAEKEPLISNEMYQVDTDHDNELTKNEVFVGSDAILIQRVSTIHRGRDRNSFETDDRRTYRFVCQGDLLPEDRRDKQTKPRHLTIIAESSTIKDCEEIEKSERVVLIFDAADKPTRVLAPIPPETSLTHATNDLASKPSALKDSPVSFEEHVRVSDHSHINIVRKARVNSCARLWDEPLTELKETRVYKQQLADATDCEPVRITRSHSMSRGPARERSLSASRRGQSPSRVERGRTPGRASRNGSVLRPLSPLLHERRGRTLPQLLLEQRPDCTPSAPLPTDLVTCMSPIKDEPARREKTPPRRVLEIDDTVDDSVDLPMRTSPTRTPEPKTLLQRTLRVSPTPSPEVSITTTIGPFTTARSVSRSPARRLPATTPRSAQKHAQPRTPSKHSPVISTADQQPLRSMRTPSPAQARTPIHTARVQSPRSPSRPVVVDEDTSAGSSQSPSRQNRTPTTVSPRRSRLTTAVYASPATTSARRRTPSRDPQEEGWERMLDLTQPASPIAASIARRIPDDFLASGSATRPSRSLTRHSRPLGPAKSCTNLVSPLPQPIEQQMAQLQQPAASRHAPRRARSEHSVLQASPAASPAGALAAPANSAIAIASPFRRQQYERQPAADVPAAVAAPMPRIPRTTRPASSAAPAAATRSNSMVGVSASAAATRRPATPSKPTAAAQPSSSSTAVRHREFTMPRNVVGKQSRGGPGAPTQKNVELVVNPDDYDEGEILKKKLTLEAKINGHLWNLSVVFALKADRADMIRFAPKRVRIDDQTLWEETENWSQTSLTPVTGPRTEARGSTSYEQAQLQPVVQQLQHTPRKPSGSSATASTQTPPAMQQTIIRVAPKTPKNLAYGLSVSTASTASSSTSGKGKSADKSNKKPATARKSTSNKSGDSDKKKKKHANTPYV